MKDWKNKPIMKITQKGKSFLGISLFLKINVILKTDRNVIILFSESSSVSGFYYLVIIYAIYHVIHLLNKIIRSINNIKLFL